MMNQFFSLFSGNKDSADNTSKAQQENKLKTRLQQADEYIEKQDKQIKQQQLELQQNSYISQQELTKVKSERDEIVKEKQHITQQLAQLKMAYDQLLKANHETCSKLEESVQQREREGKLFQTKLNQADRALQEEKEKFNQTQSEWKQEKEQFIQQVLVLQQQEEKLKADIILIKAQNDPTLVVNNFSDEGPKQIKDLYIQAKNGINDLNNSLEDELQSNWTEEMEIQFEMALSKMLFEELQVKMIEFVSQRKQLDEPSEKEIGDLLKGDQELIKELINQTSLGIQSQLKKDFECITQVEKFIDDIESLSTTCVSLISMILRNEQQLRLVWYKPKSEFNPSEQNSRNATQRLQIATVVYPCLMLKGSKTVYEHATVTTKLVKR